MEASGANTTEAQVLPGNVNPTTAAHYENHPCEPCCQTVQPVQVPVTRDTSELTLATADQWHTAENPARDISFASCCLHHVSAFIPISRKWRRDAVNSEIDAACSSSQAVLSVWWRKRTAMLSF